MLKILLHAVMVLFFLVCNGMYLTGWFIFWSAALWHLRRAIWRYWIFVVLWVINVINIELRIEEHKIAFAERKVEAFG
ncbi:hypothetical protein [Pseudomonas cichorii]|uniref:hypothetical protein n=1 Tax=Pseudomonas cichorii TaxID=36746 RepID=UPI001C87420B|nr:hypothetical protein [Pseudomonas cichorii]MBX8488213.1 hypothetical protein [Pseudomonas cichorii]MBX8513444.1 hypothetical protein [Pseudomonas cichorii]MBX8547954.1 hypothetical protein [Pseudomonas cichorii]MBX8592947.1 hypothetical protein [Pseudomonas cichorii]